jgi:hypothetical protein
MIDLVYCSECSTVFGAGVVKGGAHQHEDQTMHEGTVVTGIDESLPPSYPWTCNDGDPGPATVVNDVGEWHRYLARYVP